MEKKTHKKISLRDFGMEKIILLAVAGILLLASNVSEWGDTPKQKEQVQGKITEAADEKEEYIASLENKLVHILEKTEGVGKVEVMITLKASGESILNKDTMEQTETEKDTEGNTGKERKTGRREEETVLADEDGVSAPYVVKRLEPEIEGIVITCQGAGKARVKASVTEAAQVLFGLPASHIKVLKMEVSQ